LYLAASSWALARPSNEKGGSKPGVETRSSLFRLPLSFEPNLGQAGSSVKFVSHGALAGPGYTLFLTADGAIFEFPYPVNNAPATVTMRLAGSRSASISAADPLPGKVNYFMGNDPAKWIVGAPTYRNVDYKTVYPGIDLTFYGTQQQIEYDFLVAPGADAGQISLEFLGAAPKLVAGGGLELTARGARLRLLKPVVYQTVNGAKKPVAGRYALAGDRVRFVLGAYDHGRPLVIDPVLDYLTYLGGAGGATYIGSSQTTCAQCTQENAAQGVTVDRSGNLYVTGTTTSTSFPLSNPVQSQVKGNANQGIVFVSEINPSASSLVYSTYLGGSTYDRGSAIAVDSSGSAYVTGQAWSSDFPVTTGAYQTRCSAAAGPNNTIIPGCGSFTTNAFLTKLAPGGGSLVYSTFLGGFSDAANAVAVDSQGRAYIAGTSGDSCNSSLPLPMSNVAGSNALLCFPETANALLPQSLYDHAIHPTAGNPGAAFVAVIDAAGAHLLYSTLYGDKNPSNNVHNTSAVGTGVAVDPSGNFYLTGLTQDPALPTTPGAFQPTGTNLQANGGQVYRGFVAKFGPVTGAGTGASLLYGTYLGGTSLTEAGSDQVSGIAVDASGNAYITGYTQSYDFPVTAGANNTYSCTATSFCQNNGFLAKINATGTGLVWSTLVGALPVAQGGGSGTLYSIGAPRVDAVGNVYITGRGAYNYPVVNPLQPAAQDLHGGVFVTKYDPTGSTILFSTVIYSPLGGLVYPGGLDVDSHGDIYVGGYSNGYDLPVTGGVFQPTTNSGNSPAGFLAKIQAPGVAPTITAVENAFSNLPNSPIQSGTWVAIKGSNLSNTSPGRGWNANENFPTSMDGTSVTINGKAAFLYYISPTQVNVQAPSDDALGPVSVVVTNNGAISAPAAVQYQASSPALLQWGGGQYAYAEITRNPDNAYIGNPAIVPGTFAAKAGDILTLWVTGLGATNPPLPAGQQPQPVNGSFPTVSVAPTVTVGGVSVTVLGSILRYAGLYQVNVQLPASLPSGNLPVKVIQGSYQSPDGVLVAVQ
jgi:uncharacterized protein (TIGR03437 family)